MRNDPNDRSVDVRIGQLIEQHRETILDAYEDLLERSGNALVSRADVGEVRDHAAAVLDDVLDRLLRPERRPSEREALSAAIGTARAIQELHPSESLRAAGLLFNAVFIVLTCRLPADASLVPALPRLAIVLHDATIDRVATAAVAYVSFLRERLHESHAEERRRVARELHDLVAHSAAVVVQNLELFALHRAQDPDRAAAKFDAALHGARETVDMVRALAHDLRRSGADDGLWSALAMYLSSVPDVPAVDTRLQGDEARVPRAVRGELYLVLREAIRNAQAHAHASRVLVEVDIERFRIRACVTDDGSGFDVSAQAGGTGLASMRERIALLGGEIELTSSPGEGTSITVDVPLVETPDEPTT